MVVTLIDLFRQSVDQYPDNPMLWEKIDGEYRSLSYRMSFEMVADTATGLMDMGLEKGDRTVLLAEGRNDWVLSELGILFAGGICVPLSVKLQEPSELRFRISHSGARFAFVSTRQLNKILQIKNDLAELEKIIVLDPYGEDDPDLVEIRTVRKAGKATLKKYPDRFEERWRSVKGDDPATICYTSGTTADAKGIVLTHRNYTANVQQARAFFDVPEYYISLLILPWDHSFAHTCGIYTLMSGGASMASVEIGGSLIETTRNIGKNIKEIKPHFLLSVPALSDSFKRNIERSISALGTKVEKFFRFGLKVAYAYRGDGFRNGRWQGWRLLKPLHNLFDTMLFSKIRDQFGGRLAFFVGGGALLDIEYQRFFAAIGIPVYQGYGLTEAAPVISANHPGNLKMGTSGPVVPGLNIKICDEHGNALIGGQTGEIVVKGENVMKGYWRDSQETSKTLRDGWLRTGDLGAIDEDGYLIVLGRYKSLLISDDGEKFSPEGIEESLVGHCPYIRQIMLYNDQKPYTTALIVPHKQAILKALEPSGLTLESSDGQRAVIDLFVHAVQAYRTAPRLKTRFPGKWLPTTFAILGEPFSEANRLLNSTLKMVRWRIVQNYRDRIDFMYTAEGKDPFNSQNMTIIARMTD
jgi:long-chain acyl-CoA synthetase